MEFANITAEMSQKNFCGVIEMMLFRFNEKGGGLVTNLLNRLRFC